MINYYLHFYIQNKSVEAIILKKLREKHIKQQWKTFNSNSSENHTFESNIIVTFKPIKP
jgi:hypothetical protein